MKSQMFTVSPTRAEFLEQVHSLIEVDALLSEVVPNIFRSLPLGRRWELSDELERFKKRVEITLGTMEVWTLGGAWEDRYDLPGVVESMRKTVGAARLLVSRIEEVDLGGFENLISALHVTANYHKAVAVRGNLFIYELLELPEPTANADAPQAIIDPEVIRELVKDYAPAGKAPVALPA